MLTPFQRLLCSGIGARRILIAASGPCLRTFDYATGQPISRWSYLDSDVPIGNKSPDLHDEDENSPRKRRKLDNDDASDSGSAEILIENGSGRRKPKRHGFSAPCVTHLTSTADGRHIVIVTGEDKAIRVLKMTEEGEMHQFSQRIMPKRPSALTLTPDEDHILCSDKFGDVYSMPLLGEAVEKNDIEAQSEGPRDDELFKPLATSKTVHTKRNLQVLESQQKQKKSKKASKTELHFEHHLILGHVSLLTDLASVRLWTPEGHQRAYILTSDRDEHIRVSRGIPQAYIIENFCLGHEQFVSKLHIPSWQRETLISGGGDDYILVWDWRKGAIRNKLDLKSLLQSQARSEETDTSPISVSGIWSTNIISGNASIIIACEKTSGLFFFTLSSDGQVITDQSYFKSLPYNVLDVAVTQLEQQIIVSLDNIHEPGSDEPRTVHDSGQFVVVLRQQSDGSWEETDELSAVNIYAQETEESLTKGMDPAIWSGIFYTGEHLRKRGPIENMEEEL